MTAYEIITMLSLAIGIVYVVLSDDSRSIDEYIRNHPEEFRR